MDGVCAIGHTEGMLNQSNKPHNLDLLFRTLAGWVTHPNIGAALVLDRAKPDQEVRVWLCFILCFIPRTFMRVLLPRQIYPTHIYRPRRTRTYITNTIPLSHAQSGHHLRLSACIHQAHHAQIRLLVFLRPRVDDSLRRQPSLKPQNCPRCRDATSSRGQPVPESQAARVSHQASSTVWR